MSINIGDIECRVRPVLEGAGLRTLSARSLLASYLLGIPSGRVPVARLVALGELFGLRSGTVRTALSRMVASGEVESDGGAYSVAGRLTERRRQQDDGVQPSPSPSRWDGEWWTAIVTDDSRSLAERRAFRASMTAARMGELRPDLWMRPTNLPAPNRTHHTETPDPSDEAGPVAASTRLVVVRGPLVAGHDADLARRLWDVDGIARGASLLVDALAELDQILDSMPTAPTSDTSERGADATALVLAFDLSAACVRFLRTEPQLPTELVAIPSAQRLRRRYVEFNGRFTDRLRAHLRNAS